MRLPDRGAALTRPVAILTSLLISLLAGGCMSVGPDYVRPKFDSPAAFDAADGQALAAPGLEQAAWWKSFGDPVLDDLVARAARGNLDVAQARARVAQARAEVTVARAESLPTLDGSASTNTSSGNASSTSAGLAPNNSQSGQAATTFKAGFDAAWELDVFGGKRREREAARATLEAQVEDMRATVLTLVGDVVRCYVLLRQYQTRLDIARKAAESQRQNVEVTTERARIGLISHLDVAQAKGQLATTLATVPTLEAQARQAIHRLSVLLGQDPASLSSLLSPAGQLPAPEDILSTGLPSELLTRRPDLRKAERQLASASAEIGVATAERYPKFDLAVSLGGQGSGLGTVLNLANWYWSIIPSVTAPLFDGGKGKAGVEKKKAAYDEALAGYRAAFLTALEETENALDTIASEDRRRKDLAESVRAGEEALSLARERYSKGLTSFLDVLSAEKSLYEAQDAACQARSNRLVGMVTLYKALGGGWDNPALNSITASNP